ncbi:iduronate-2-sulfatase [Verrucomicrobia bacterium S94]|nr:iduronate-2-sulfatase [Verrucomicrobia bacterium S94]
MKILSFCFFLLTALSAFAKQPNILFIGVDDLRPELGCYGSPIAVTPNIDRLAADGLLFNRAYCQQSICGPSRASLMTGLRPDSSGVTHNYLEFRDLRPDVITLAQHFKNNGYETVYHGKIFHGKHTDDAFSWSRKPAKTDLPKPKGFALAENIEIQQNARKEMFARYGEMAKYGLASGPAWECADVPDETYSDGRNTLIAIETLKELAQEEKPFFLAIGFKKPHLNWVAPKRYWDLYDRDKIPLAQNTEAPVGGASMGLHPSFELRVRQGIPTDGKPFDEELARTLKHAYLACVSYVDAQIGKMIHALDEAGLRDHTIIIVWADHGWHLGEMGTWGKATTYEVATRVPLIIWTPDMPQETRGQKTDALVELIDMYPTLSDLAGLQIPEHVEGSSFRPLLTNPSRPWKKAAFSQFPTPALREWGSIALRPGMRETYFGPLADEMEKRIQKQLPGQWDRKLFEENLTGYAMRTDRYRLTVWKDAAHPDREPLFIELYDHKTDPLETVNIARSHPEVVEMMMKHFSEGWEAARPEC